MAARPLAVAIVASLTLILAAPYVGQLRGAVQDAMPGQYRTIVGSTIAIAVLAAMLIAVVRIRERRILRYSAIAIALSVGIVYALVSATGNANVDVVERFHFVEYGVLAWLFYRVWRDREDLGTIAAPLLAAWLVGVGDESTQWFVPARIGELHDVLLDGVAAGCGLLFCLGADPPTRLSPVLWSGSSRAAAPFVTVAIVATAAFFHTVHIGYEIRDGRDMFRSRYSRGELDAVAGDRAMRWRVDPPVSVVRLSREDQYLSEGLWHVQRRNQLAGEHGDVVAAWRENLILERFFAPVLDAPSYAAAAGTRWPDDQRADMLARAGDDQREYVSDANPFPIYAWNPALFWAAVAVTIAAAVVCCLALEARARARQAAAL